MVSNIGVPISGNAIGVHEEIKDVYLQIVSSSNPNLEKSYQLLLPGIRLKASKSPPLVSAAGAPRG